MKIILVRHGKPNINSEVLVKPNELEYWKKQYDIVDLDPNSFPTQEVIQEVSNSNVLICSKLNRSIKSAKILIPDKDPIIENDFHEVGVPHTNIKLPKFKLSFYAIIFRILWLFGYSKNCEPKKESKNRAIIAAQKLSSIAEEKKSVAFIGHAIFNYYIAKVLRKNGWDGPKYPTKTFWDFAIYTKEINDKESTTCNSSRKI